MTDRNEGEGNKTAARHYNEKTEAFAKSGRVEKGARDAEKAVEGDEARALEHAETVGKSHAAGEDPAVEGKKKSHKSA
jgi:hypothetical protein